MRRHPPFKRYRVKVPDGYVWPVYIALSWSWWVGDQFIDYLELP